MYSKNATFNDRSRRKKEQYRLPFKTRDKMEEELKNLDIRSTSDNRNDRLKIVRRNSAIQKDFFSMAEYLVYSINQAFELDYYKRHYKSGRKRIIALFE